MALDGSGLRNVLLWTSDIRSSGLDNHISLQGQKQGLTSKDYRCYAESFIICQRLGLELSVHSGRKVLYVTFKSKFKLELVQAGLNDRLAVLRNNMASYNSMG